MNWRFYITLDDRAYDRACLDNKTPNPTPEQIAEAHQTLSEFYEDEATNYYEEWSKQNE